MNKPKINAPSAGGSKEPIVEKEQKVVEEAPKEVAKAPEPVKLKEGAAFLGANRRACNWHITRGEKDGHIEAHNATTKTRFSGTMAEFNARLRG